MHSIDSLEAVEKKGASALLAKMMHRDNLNLAYKRVKQNGGAAGVDKMTVDEMLPYLKAHKAELLDSIRGGWYKPRTSYPSDMMTYQSDMRHCTRTIEPPYTERYIRWCERTMGEIITHFLRDWHWRELTP